MPKLSRKAWKHKINELRGRRKRLKRLIKEAEGPELPALEKERDKIVAELDRLEEVGIRLSYTRDGGAAKAAGRRYGDLVNKTTEEIEAFIEEVDEEIDRATSSSDSAQIRKLEAEKKGLVQELVMREPRTRHRSTWWRWYKGPGRVRFWRGSP